MAANILQQIELPEGIVRLYDWMSPEVLHGQNLVMLCDGQEVWKAVPPGGGTDCFTDISLEDGVLLAHTWSCYKVWIDVESGKITAQVFTK